MGGINLPLRPFACLPSYRTLVSPKDHTMALGYLEATALSIQLVYVYRLLATLYH